MINLFLMQILRQFESRFSQIYESKQASERAGGCRRESIRCEMRQAESEKVSERKPVHKFPIVFYFIFVGFPVSLALGALWLGSTRLCSCDLLALTMRAVRGHSQCFKFELHFASF